MSPRLPPRPPSPLSPPGAPDPEKVLRIIERLEGEIAALRSAEREPIAVVGMSCRFPGADGPDAFWSRLYQGEETTGSVPRDRWNIDALYSADPDAPGKMSTRYGGFLDHVDQFDAAFFGIAPREAMVMDPQQRLLLELSWEALEDAGLSPDALYGSPSGVFVGVCASDYCRMALQNVDNVTAYLGTGNATSVAAGRIAYTFGFSGPCMSLDTACSSALVAVHYAGESLRRGECRVALAASVNLILAPEITVAFSKARMMAPDGRCKTFDERADGYVRSEGAAVLALKTLSSARADGDRILAVIRGTAINQDGASGGLTVPSGPSQTALVRQALARAGVTPNEIDYLEAHGTGTALGDPIEVGALAEVFAQGRPEDRPLLLGSVKTLVGHLEVAAGMAGLLKVILALQHDAIPGYPQLQELSSRIPWGNLPFAVPRRPVPWPRGKRPRLAGVSAFGFSGTNAHVVVEEPPRPADRETGTEDQPAHVVCLSARTPDALGALAQRYAAWLGRHPGATLDEIAWTANAGRARLSQRLAVVADSPASLQSQLAAFAETRIAAGRAVQLGTAPALEGQLAFLFTGQGSQYAGMGKELHDRHPAFRQTIARCEDLLAGHLDRPLRELLWGEHTALLNQTRYTQPVLFALEIALANLWQSWGVRPAYVMGHSVGELAAACVAGVFDLGDGLRLVAARGRLMQELPGGGAMAVVLAGRDVIEPVIDAVNAQRGDRLALAGENAPDQTIISGDRAAVLEACERLAVAHGIANRGLLDVSHAFHSPLMRPILEPFRAVAETVTYHRPTIDVISNVTGKVAGDAMATAAYWVDHVLAPVDFMAGVRALAAADVAGLLEVGPGATLIGLATACAGPGRFVTAASLRPKVAPWSQVLEALATLFVHGFAVDLRKAGRCDQPPPARRGLPTYPFQRQRYWIHGANGSMSPVGSMKPAATAGDRHPLLGQRLRSAVLPPGDLLFEGALSLESPPYLRHHRVYDKVVVPAVAYVEMALAGIQRELPQASAVLRNMAVQAALVLQPGVETVIQTHFAEAGGNRYRFQIFSAAADAPAAWQVHTSGEIEVTLADGDAAPAIDAPRVHERFDERGERLDIARFYEHYAALGLPYTGEFRSVVELRHLAGDGARPAEVLARIRPPGVSAGDAASYGLHPAVLDGCFQAVGAMVAEHADVVYLPVGIGAVRPRYRAPLELWAHAVLLRSPAPDDPRIVADLRLIDDLGRVVCVVEGLVAMRAERRALAYATATWKNKLYTLGWIPQSLPELPTATDAVMQPSEPRRRWLVFGDRGGAGAALQALLEAQGEACALIGEADVVLDKAAWSRVLASQAATSDRPLAGIVHLWALDDALDDPMGDAREAHGDARAGLRPSADLVAPRSPLDQAARSCGSTLAIVQALMDTPNQRLPRLLLVTRGALAIADGEPVSTTAAAVWGLGRTIALEHPSLGCTCVDIDTDDTRALVAELLHPDGELQVALRAGKRYAARLSRGLAQPRVQLAVPGERHGLPTPEHDSLERPPVAHARPPTKRAVRHDRSYWIAGGLGALGLSVARSLVASGARQLVLSGRSDPDAGAHEAIASWRAAGVEVVLERMDVADAEQVAAAVQRITGHAHGLAPLGGIVHAAGVLDDGVIVRQTWPRFLRVLAPKVAGAWNLHVATRALALDFFVMFSSIAALMGAPGQANYAAANAFLDGLAAHRRSLGLPATCIAWGPWATSGMAEQARDANRTRFALFGVSHMSVGDNLEVFEHLLDQAPVTVAVADVDWTKYLKAVMSPGIARVYALLDQAAARAVPAETGALLARLVKEPDDRREAVLVDFLRRQVASVVGLASPEAIELTQRLLDVGFDSLMAVELKNRVEASLGATLSPTLLFDHPTLAQLARHLLADVLHLRAASEVDVRATTAPLAGEPASNAAVPLATLRESFIAMSDGAKLCICSWGPDDAPLVVCVHGILDQAASWDEVAIGLALRGYRVVALDLRGHGRSAHVPANTAITILDFLLDLTTLVTSATLKATRPFVLLGHSMGAAVAGLFASAYPERVERLILVEPVMPHLRDQQGALELLKNELRYLQEPPAHVVYPDLATAARMLTLSHGGLGTSRSMRLAQRIAKPCEGGLRWAWDARLRNPMGVDPCFSRERYLELFGALDLPSIWIYGATSQFAGTPVLLPLDATLPRSRSVRIAGGHNLHTEAAATLLAEVLLAMNLA